MDDAITSRFRGLDFSEEEWLQILNICADLPSERREVFGETIELQIRMLPMQILDAYPGTEWNALARRVSALSKPFAHALLEVIERFWSGKLEGGTFKEHMNRIGVHFCESAHGRMEALATRKEMEDDLIGKP